MSIAEQKIKLTQSLLSISDKSLLNQISNLINVHEAETDFWSELPVQVRDDVEEAQLQAKQGKGKSHKAVMTKYKQWL